MDEFEKRLKQDAASIRAEVSPQLEERISASLHSAGRDVPLQKPRATTGNLWWASSLTGLAAAVIVILLVNWNRDAVEPQVPLTTTAGAVPDHREYLRQLQQRLPLQTETVEFTQALDEELVRLQADLEKARESVSRDIDFTF